MIIYPAIDLRGGRVVRLTEGKFDQEKSYGDDPLAVAKDFAASGATWLHVVDLNGAFEGQPVNGAAVEAILGATRNPVQLGGGIRNLAQIETWLGKGLAL